MKGKEGSGTMLQCSHCPKEFRYNSEKMRHELSHFPHFECDTCGKTFSFISALRRHQKQHERTGSVACKKCKHKFRDEALLKRHIKYAHKGTFICAKCQSKFNSELALSTHMKTHRPEAERRFKCSYKGCTKSFNFSHHLRHHELTHTNAKQHYCSVCGKGFIQSHHLKTHMRNHNPVGRLVCGSPGCFKMFSTDYARKRHMATHGNKPDSGISSDSNSCDVTTVSRGCQEHILGAGCGQSVIQDKYLTHSDISKTVKDCNKTDTEIDSDIDVGKISRENTNLINNSTDFGDEKNIDVEKVSKEKSSLIKIYTDMEEWPDSPFQPNNYKNNNTGQSVKEKDVNKNKMVNCAVKDDHSKNLDSNSRNNSTINSTGIPSSQKANNLSPLIVKTNNSDYQGLTDICEGCDCDNICNAKISMYDIPNSAMIPEKEVATNIECGVGGVIKLKYTFDDDIFVRKDDDTVIAKDNSNDNKRYMFSTCKDVLGNCLVSGDSCLCARMMVEDQAVMAQEIDDITPQPKTEPS